MQRERSWREGVWCLAETEISSAETEVSLLKKQKFNINKSAKFTKKK